MIPGYDLGPGAWPFAVLLGMLCRHPLTGRLIALKLLGLAIACLLIAPYAMTALDTIRSI